MAGKTAVFPAAGKLGGAIYRHLLERQPPSSVILISRNPSKIPAHHVDAGVECRKADYDDPTSFEGAFDGVDTLVLISHPGISSDVRFHAHKRTIDEAVASGVRQIFYTSLAFAGGLDDSVAHVMQAHLRTEAYLRELSGKGTLSYTVIREGIYSESWPLYLAHAKFDSTQNNILQLPSTGDAGGIAWIKIEDLGEATAALVHRYLTSPTKYAYKDEVVVLSGSKSYTLRETAVLLAKQAGGKVRIETIPIETYAQTGLMKRIFGTEDNVTQWATMYKAVEAGECELVNGLAENLLGRAPESFETSVRTSLSTYV